MLHDAACARICARSSSIGFGNCDSASGSNGPGKDVFPQSGADRLLRRLLDRGRAVGVPERLRQRRVEVAVGLVEEDCQRPARPEHACDLRERLRSREPVERLARRRRHRRRRPRAGSRPRSRRAPPPRARRARARPASPPAARPRARARIAARAAASACRCRRRGRARRRPAAGRRRRAPPPRSPAAPARTPPPRGRSCRARSVIYPTPARRKARLSRSISRAITRRCTSCVPS